MEGGACWALFGVCDSGSGYRGGETVQASMSGAGGAVVGSVAVGPSGVGWARGARLGPGGSGEGAVVEDGTVYGGDGAASRVGGGVGWAAGSREEGWVWAVGEEWSLGGSVGEGGRRGADCGSLSGRGVGSPLGTGPAA